MSLKSKPITICIFVKSVDGGTGTYVESMLKLPKYSCYKNLRIEAFCLETPQFRQSTSAHISFFRKKKFYPEEYRFSLFQILSFLKEMWWVVSVLRTVNPQIVVGVDVHCNLLLMLVKFSRVTTFKAVLTTHINLHATLRDKSSFVIFHALKLLVTFFYNRSDALVCVSKDLSKSIRKEFCLSVPVKTIYNGLTFQSDSTQAKSPHKGVRKLITVARHTRQKDFKTLLLAFSLVSKDLRGVRLTILSSGVLQRKIAGLAKELGLEKNVDFPGWVPNVHDSLAQSDVFLFSSKREGFGYVIIEAMSHGLPVVSTLTPFGPREVLQNGTYGKLVPVQNPKMMAEAISQLLNNQNIYKKFSKLSLERSKFFSEDKMLKGYCQLIKSLSS